MVTSMYQIPYIYQPHFSMSCCLVQAMQQPMATGIPRAAASQRLHTENRISSSAVVIVCLLYTSQMTSLIVNIVGPVSLNYL